MENSAEHPFHVRLKQLLQGKTLKRIAADLDINFQNVQRYLSGRYPGTLFLMRLASVYGVNINWLLTGEGSPYGEPVMTKISALDNPMVLPMLGYVSADPYTSLVREPQNEYETIEIRPKLGTLRVDGNSMSPVAWEGQHLLVHLEEPPKNGNLAVVRTKDERVYFKRYFYDDRLQIVSLLSVNPTEPLDPVHLERHDIAHSYRVVGVLYE